MFIITHKYYILKQTKNTGFTLVELVVVATILAILSAVGFSAYTSYISGARDTNRIVELGSIRAGLQTYLINSNSGLPLPGDYVTIQDGVDIIGYQGYASQDILNTIDLKKGGTDPKDGTFYSYYVSETRNSFQLLGFLEEENTELTTQLSSAVSAIDYSSRYPTVTGESLGIMVGTGNDANVPIQELDQIVTTSNGILDIGSTATQYTAIVKDDYIVTGDSTKLGVVSSLARTGGKIGKSCKDLIDSNQGLLGQDGNYFLDLDGGDLLEIYCDMTTDGGGWTRLKSETEGWISDDDALRLPDSSEILFDYNSNVTGSYVDHQYKVAKFTTQGDSHQEITDITHLINIILGKSPSTGAQRTTHTGDLYEFKGENIGAIYDDCHDDENISISNYSMYSFYMSKKRFQFYGSGTNTIWGGGTLSYGYNTNQFQTNYCGGGLSGNNVSSYAGNRTDMYIR